MNPELKAYLDEWAASNKRVFDDIHDALLRVNTAFGAADHDNSTPVVTADGVVGSEQPSSGTTELVTPSVGLANPQATGPIIEESLAVAPAASILTNTMAPAFCSTERASRDATKSTAVSTPETAPQMLSNQALSMVIDRATYPITNELLHQLFDPYGVEQLAVYPPIISDGEPCVAADVRFSSQCAAAQAYADWDGRCIYYRCCRLQMWLASADVLPAQPLAATTRAAALVLHEDGNDPTASTPSNCFDNNIVGPVQASSDATKVVTVSVELAEPPATVSIMEESLVSAATSNGTIDDKSMKVAASTALISLLESSSSNVSALVCALSPDAPPTVSSTPIAPTPQELTTAQSLKPSIVLGLGTLVPAKCSPESFDMGVVDITKHYVFVSHDADENGVLSMVNTNCDDTEEDHRPSWPPSLLVLAYVMSELQHDKVQWQPWPPPLVIYLQSTLVAAAAMNQNGFVTCVLGAIDQEEQFTYLCANLNVLKKILKKPCAEREEAIWSGLISRATRDLKLCCIPWSRFLILEMTSEEVLHCLSEENQATAQYFNDSVPPCVHRLSLALFQWEIAWQLGSLDSERGCYYQVTMESEMLDMQQLQQLQWFDISDFTGYNTLGSTYNLFSCGTDQTRKVQSYMKISYSDHCQVGMYFKVGHTFYPVAQYTTLGGSHCGNAALYPSFPTCTCMRMEQLKGSGELIQWLTNNPGGYGISTIKLSWVFMDLDGTANQQWKIYWDPGAAFRIWLVAWTTDCLKFSRSRGQAPFQGGRNAIRAVFTDQVHVSQDYYIACTNQIVVDSAYYLEQAYYIDMVCSYIIYYRQNSHQDSSKIKEVHMPWDPGKSSFKHITPKIRLGDKPSFKEGGMLGPSSCARSLGRCHGLATRDSTQPIVSFRSTLTNIQRQAWRKVSKLDQAKRHRRLLSPT